MEFVEGARSRAGCTRAARSWREIVDVFVQAGRGLAAAHAVGIVHRDFKPDNVLVGDDGRVRVADFGIALLGPVGRDATGEDAGTGGRARQQDRRPRRDGSRARSERRSGDPPVHGPGADLRPRSRRALGPVELLRLPRRSAPRRAPVRGGAARQPLRARGAGALAISPDPLLAAPPPRSRPPDRSGRALPVDGSAPRRPLPRSPGGVGPARRCCRDVRLRRGGRARLRPAQAPAEPRLHERRRAPRRSLGRRPEGAGLARVHGRPEAVRRHCVAGGPRRPRRLRARVGARVPGLVRSDARARRAVGQSPRLTHGVLERPTKKISAPSPTSSPTPTSRSSRTRSPPRRRSRRSPTAATRARFERASSRRMAPRHSRWRRSGKTSRP